MKDEFEKSILGYYEFFVDVNFKDQNGCRPEFQVEIPVKLKTGLIPSISDLTMSYLAQRLTIGQISNQSIMTDFNNISGLKYAKKIFSRICFFC